jgi:D-alanine-D-alanine ligase
MNNLQIIILCGGLSNEREYSLKSAYEIANKDFILVELKDNKLPDWIDGTKHIVFNMVFGEYGEDGGLQRDCDNRGIIYTGCDYVSSKLCINKPETKKKMRNVHPYSIPELVFDINCKPSANELIEKFGEDIVIKPSNQGSSIGLNVLHGYNEITNCIDSLKEGEWMVERRLIGREMTIGLLNGKAMGIVELFPPNGINNFEYKYNNNKKIIYPALIADELTLQIQLTAEKIFKECGCRDYARMDLILQPDNKFYFLEINTIPNMTKSSIFAKSASCINIDFTNLVNEIIKLAYTRFLIMNN